MAQIDSRLAVKMMMILAAVVVVVKAHLIAKVEAVRVIKATIPIALAKKKTRITKLTKA